MSKKPPQAGDGLKAENANWRFDAGVAQGFDVHAARSIPFYAEGQDLVLKASDFFISDDSLIYDLGTATGSLALALGRRHAAKPGVRIIGLDRQAEMIDRAEQKREAADCGNVSFQVEDLLQAELQASDLMVSYYTLQFVRPKVRQQVFDKIYAALNWGGALLLFEKVRAPDARFQDIATALYTDYKLDKGYAPDEIIAKARSLKGVLEPFSTQGNLDLLKRAGFVDIMPVFKYVCFEGVLAIK